MSVLLDPNGVFQQVIGLWRDCPAISATITLPLGVVRRTVRLDAADIMVDATYAASATDFYAFTLVWGSGPTTAASWSTQTSAQGAITAAVPSLMVLSADANLIIPPGSVVKLIATKNASAANITPRIVMSGRIVA